MQLGSPHTPPLSSPQPHHHGSAGTPGPTSLAYAASQCDVLQSHPVCGMPEPTNEYTIASFAGPPLIFEQPIDQQITYPLKKGLDVMQSRHPLHRTSFSQYET